MHLVCLEILLSDYTHVMRRNCRQSSSMFGRQQSNRVLLLGLGYDRAGDKRPRVRAVFKRGALKGHPCMNW